MQDAPALRPLGVGDIVDRIFRMYRARPLVLLTVSAIPYLLLVLVAALVAGTMLPSLGAFAELAELGEDIDPARLTDEAILGAVLALLRLVVLVGLAGIVLLSVQVAALIDAVSAQYLSRGTTAGRALAAGVRAAFRLAIMGILVTLAVLGLWGVSGVLMVLAGEWWAFVLLGLAALIGTVYLTASWMISPVVATFEGSGPLVALSRSWSLSQGHRWRILGMALLLFVLQAVLTALLTGFIALVPLADDLASFVLQQGASVLATIAWSPIYYGSFTLFYFDLRVRKEAYDLQLAAEALPRAL